MKVFDPFRVNFSGIHLIEASAGTGKTYNIASLYIRSIIENRSVDEILVVTYTNAATKELRDRLIRRIRESIQALNGGNIQNDTFLTSLQNEIVRKKQAVRKLKAALRNFDEASVYTIHGFCQHVLQEYAFESGAPFSAELIGDDSNIVQEVVDDYWRNWIRKNSDDVHRRSLIKFMIDQGYTPDKLARELGNYVGKPYLDVNPERVDDELSNEKLRELNRVFQHIKQGWRHNSQEIIDLLHSKHLSNYRKSWLKGWINQMESMLQAEAAPIQYFDQIKRFSQSFIDDNLKKASQKRGVLPPQHQFFNLIDSFIDIADNLQDKNYDVTFKRALFDHLVDKMNEKKEEQQVYSYDDLLVRLRNALRGSRQGNNLDKKLRSAYPVALVDEFQDTDPVQYEIFKTIYSGNQETALFMIGDPKQSIYSFRGADVFVYLQARGETPKENRYSLEYNYRSTPHLLEAFNEFFGSSANPFLLESIPYQSVEAGRENMARLQLKNGPEAPFVIRQLAANENSYYFTKDEAKEWAAMDVASQIKNILDDIDHGQALIGDTCLEAEDVAVLVRDHSQAELVKEELKQREINCVTHSKKNVFESEEARHIAILMKAVAEPSDERLAAAALSTPLFDYTGNDLFELQENGDDWAVKLDQFHQWNQLWEKHGFSFFFRMVMQEENIADTVMKRGDGERRLTNLTHLAGLLREEEDRMGHGIHALVKWLSKKRQEDKSEADEEQLRLESDENLVQIITQHHSKGLEYPVVFCPFLWYAKQNSDDGSPISYHDPDDTGRTILDLKGKDDPERNRKRFVRQKEIMEESLRLAYVALTRAKQKCIINWIYANESERSPLSHLLLSENQSFEALKAASKDGSDYIDQIQRSLDDLTKKPGICVESVEENGGEVKDEPSQSETVDLEAKTFHRSAALPGGKSVSSFSSLTKMSQEVDLDITEYYDQMMAQKTPDEKASGIFSFPRGPAPGTAIHHIFENINFENDSNWSATILKYLNRENIGRKWQPVVYDMLQETINKPLLPSDPSLKLAGISSEEMVAEMRFHLSNRHVELQELLNIIRSGLQQEKLPESFANEGFITGFIDLTFCLDGQYYILDYKTNYLGNKINDYDKEEMDKAMESHFYDLQYHLYLVALHRFLKQKLPNYDYKKHIGGVFYLFVRGINEDTDAGIYFDRPDAEKINKLDSYFKGDRQ